MKTKTVYRKTAQPCRRCKVMSFYDDDRREGGSVIRLRRPMIDINPDAALKFYGFRIARDGAVFATTARMTHGRTNKNYEVMIGTVERDGRSWIARALDGTKQTNSNQDSAGRWLENYTENNQS